MYNCILGIFLGNIKALRYYVGDVDGIIQSKFDDSRNNRKLSGNKTIALLLKSCAMKKKDGISNYAEEMTRGIPEDTAEEDKVFIVDFFNAIETMVDNINLKDTSAYGYTRLSKEVKEEYQKLEVMANQKTILYNGSLMLLFTYYENLVSNLFKSDFVKHPERINLDSKAVTYKMMTQYSDIAIIKEVLLEEEITAMMYKSHDDWMDFFSNKIKLKIPYIKDKENEIKEIISRRNLFVHNNGVVNSIYLNNTGIKNLKVGDILKINSSYLNKAIDIIEASGTSLVIESWLKEYGSVEEEVNKISAILYSECLEMKKWELGKYLYDICYKCKHLSDADSLMFRINMWQCYKWSDEMEIIIADLLKLDVSASMPRYRLAILALQDKEEQFWKEYDKQKEIDEYQLREWPIFENIRQGKVYVQRYTDLNDKKDLLDDGMKEGEADCAITYIDAKCAEK